MKKLLGSIAILALAMPLAAQAADLPAAPVYKAPVYVPPPSDWTGFYIGGDIGGRWSNSTWSTTCLETGQPGTACTTAPADALIRFATNNPTTFNSTSFKGGGYAGYNWQVNPVWVVGVEGDWQWANNSTTVSGIPGAENLTVIGAPGLDTSTVKQTWDASARGRVGYLVAPSWMVFGTGGVAFTNVQASAHCGTLFPVGWCGQAANIGRTDTASLDRVGWTAGAGVEGMIAPNWLARIEYRYANYGNNMSFTMLQGPASNIDAISGNLKLQDQSVTVGIAYKFGGPVVARY
jgi:outer membrane immunogenic protein